MTQIEKIKNSLVSTNRLIDSDWPKWIITGLVISALLGFAVTWFNIDPEPNAPITANTSSTYTGSYAEQIKSEAPKTRNTVEEITNILSTRSSPNDNVSKIKATPDHSSDGWSADSFLDVLEEPSTDSSTASTIEKVTKQTFVVKKDPYIASLVNEAVDLSVLRPNDAANAKISGDQASFTTYISVEETESTPLQLSPDGLLIVQDGDSLSQIALRLYGDSTMYKRIFEENRDTLNDPNIVLSGAQLRIPASQ